VLIALVCFQITDLVWRDTRSLDGDVDVIKNDIGQKIKDRDLAKRKLCTARACMPFALLNVFLFLSLLENEI